jgi:ABC-type bacteriocin/lantibiotic exporter with double-glycine peptidase domain
VKPFIGPIPSGELSDEWSDGVCMQSTLSTCGAASLATVLTFLGEVANEAELAKEAHSYRGGTEAWYLARAARARGFGVRFEIASGFAGEGDFPAVVGVRLGVVGHFIPILRREGAQFLVGDPIRGRELLSKEELQERYDFTGFSMRIRRM